MKKFKNNTVYAAISLLTLIAVMASAFALTGCDNCGVYDPDDIGHRTEDPENQDTPGDGREVEDPIEEGRVRLVRVGDKLMHPQTGLDVIVMSEHSSGRILFTCIETGDNLTAIIDSEGERYIFFPATDETPEVIWVIPVLDDDDPEPSGGVDETTGGSTAAPPATNDQGQTVEPPRTNSPGGTGSGPGGDNNPVYSNLITVNGTSATADADERHVQITTNSSGVLVIQIRRPGTYTITGKSSEVAVNVGSNDGFPGGTVTLNLRNVDLTHSHGPAIRATGRVGKLVIVNEPGTTNTLRDTRPARPADAGERDDISEAVRDGEQDPMARNAALFTNNTPLDITGRGTLIVHGRFGHGIHARGASLTILGGANVNVASAEAIGLRARHAVTIDGSTVSITTKHKGIRGAGEQHGNVVIRNKSTVTMTTPRDAIQSENNVTVQNSTVNATVDGGWRQGRHPVQGSRVAVRARGNVVITGGNLTLHAAEHGINSSGTVNISGGATMNVETSGRGIRGQHGVTLNGANVTIGIANVGIHGGSMPGSHVRISGGNVSIHYIQTAFNQGLPAGAPTSGYTHSHCAQNCSAHR
jgi:hypothetical protein